jgi:hypothetical protein
MQNKTQLIQQFNQARDEFRALLPGMDIHMEIYPGWTIKEVLAHLAGWDDATILALEAFTSGNPPPVPALLGIDLYNSQTVAERTTLDYEQIIREWEWVREKLVSILENITDENLEATIVSPWGPSMTVAELINVMTEHEEEHAEVIRGRLVT